MSSARAALLAAQILLGVALVWWATTRSRRRVRGAGRSRTDVVAIGLATLAVTTLLVTASPSPAIGAVIIVGYLLLVQFVTLLKRR